MRRLLQQVAANGRDSPLIPETDADAVLRLDRVSYRWPDGSQALHRCSLSIPRPGLWMLVGSNGSGKSTLFRLIAGLMQPQEGRIHTAQRVALVFQNPDHQLLLPSCNSDLLLGLAPQATTTTRFARVEQLLEQLGLTGLGSRPIHTLSGGQKQRLAIAGALASDAGLLLLDEPTALLDPTSQRNVLDAVDRLCHQETQPLTALWITHRLEELDRADGATCMQHGQIQGWMDGKELRHRLQCGRLGL